MELPPLDVDKAKALLAGSFGVELVKLIANHVTFFTFGFVGPDGAANFKSASCFFLETPRKTLLVTAKHVFQEYCKDKESMDGMRCQIGNKPFFPTEALVGMGDRVDIVSFEYSKVDISASGKHPIAIWPPDPPVFPDTGIVHAGFPRKEMTWSGPRTGSFGLYVSIGVSTIVTDRQITCDIVWEDSAPIASIGPMPPPKFETGGMSGGPMLSIRERNGFLSFPLAGVISEGYAERDRVIGERADSIRSDGSIRG